MSLVVVVHVIHGVVRLMQRVLLLVLFHHLAIYGVMHLEALCFDLLLPVVIMNLDVVKNCIDKDTNIWILVRKEFEHN